MDLRMKECWSWPRYCTLSNWRQSPIFWRTGDNCHSQDLLHQMILVFVLLSQELLVWVLSFSWKVITRIAEMTKYYTNDINNNQTIFTSYWEKTEDNNFNLNITICLLIRSLKKRVVVIHWSWRRSFILIIFSAVWISSIFELGGATILSVLVLPIFFFFCRSSIQWFV